MCTNWLGGCFLGFVFGLVCFLRFVWLLLWLWMRFFSMVMDFVLLVFYLKPKLFCS